MSGYALITGGTKGIGFSVAKCLGEMGYNLILTFSTDNITAEKACSYLQGEYKIEATAIKADNTDKKSIDIISQHIDSRDIMLDVIVFNAGITCRDNFEEIKYEDWDNVFYANVHFPVFLLQKNINNINTGGSVIFTGSLMGIIPHAMSLSYGVTKAAVHSLVKNLVKFLSPRNIRVNAVAPGFIDTEWQKDKPAEIRKSIESKISVRRFCDPDELAGVYKLLVENTYLNGEIIVSDGGYSYK